RLSSVDLESRWPQIRFSADDRGIFEPSSGVLMARRSVALVAAEAVRAGARFVADAIEPPIGRSGSLASVVMHAGDALHADTVVFACGPWLPKIFPDLLGDRLFVTRQEVLYFGPPPGDARFAPPNLPAWIDFGAEMYGVPDIEGRGFKIALDRHGP